jgi:CheY-like chemotaxis protein
MPQTVLVVEDDHQYRASIIKLIGSLGVECLSAENGAEALVLISDTTCALDLVVTDMRMPGGSGWKVIDAVRARRGTLPIIMQTGESQYDDVRIRAEQHVVPLIAKKDLFDELVPAVRVALRLHDK